jgi:micrococcal nuclease
MRNRYFIKYAAISLFLITFLFAANNSVGSSEADQSVSELVQLIAKLTERISALEQRIQILEAQIKTLEAERGKSEAVEGHQVLRVIDGDTILISTGESVRYLGIDTPETVDPRKPVEYFGKEAAEYNRKLVFKKKVRLEFDVQKRDKYGRLLAYVYLEDGTFVNAELVKHGYARVATYPPNVKHQDLFLTLEREARENNRGLWDEEKRRLWECESQIDKTEPKTNENITPPCGEQNKASDIVYITATGTKYHRAGCSYLSKSSIPIERKEAIAKGYTPCSVCKP